MTDYYCYARGCRRRYRSFTHPHARSGSAEWAHKQPYSHCSIACHTPLNSGSHTSSPALSATRARFLNSRSARFCADVAPACKAGVCRLYRHDYRTAPTHSNHPPPARPPHSSAIAAPVRPARRRQAHPAGFCTSAACRPGSASTARWLLGSCPPSRRTSRRACGGTCRHGSCRGPRTARGRLQCVGVRGRV